MKLASEQNEALADMLFSDSWPALLKLVDSYASNIESRVLKYNLEDGLEGLAAEKARGEGARQLQIAIIGIKNKFRKSDSGL